MTSGQTFSVLSERSLKVGLYLSGNLMTLGLLRRFLILQVFTWPFGDVNSCLCFTSSGPRPDVEAEACVLQRTVAGVYEP